MLLSYISCIRYSSKESEVGEHSSQDSSVYLVAGILVLCKSAAAVAVELRVSGSQQEAAPHCCFP